MTGVQTCALPISSTLLRDELGGAKRVMTLSIGWKSHLSLGNLYHELCHRYIHANRGKNAAEFRGTCKDVFFLIQNLHFLESGHFILNRKDLKEAVAKEDWIVLELADLPDGYDFDQAFSSLFAWCQSAFARIEHLGGK